MRIGLGAELEPNRVVRVASQQLAAHLVVDDVVRRTDDIGDVGEPGRRGVVVVGEPDAVGHGRPAESVEGVVQPAERRDARASRAQDSGDPPVRPSRPPERSRLRPDLGTPVLRARSSSRAGIVDSGPAFPSAAIALRSRRWRPARVRAVAPTARSKARVTHREEPLDERQQRDAAAGPGRRRRR